ncbi:MAG: IS1380 family transposase [Anaerolineae bacterium]|nr:IS1380 family transposase [Anaerolineae bacterium]
MVLFSGLAKQVGLESALREALPFQLTSPNATDPVEIVLAFMASVLTGAKRLAHMERLRWDEGVKEILGVDRFVSDTTLGRFLRRFHVGTVTTVFEKLMRWELSMVDVKSDILDLDSSVFERYGKQEGVTLGYNSKKHRRPTHHPLIATLGNRPWVVHAWLRSGNAGSARGADAFLDEVLAMLPQGVSIPFLRADSGFGIEPFLSKVESKTLLYAVAARFTKGLKNKVTVISDWRELEPGIAVSETIFQAQGWSRERRVVLIRQRTQENDFVRGRELFDDPAYVYQGIVTNRHESPEEIWRFYRKHADIENQIRELKWDYGMDGFCQKKFFATEAAFRFVCVAYNLVSLLQSKLGFSVFRTLGTLRTQILAVGAILGRDGRNSILRMSIPERLRTRFDGYLQALFPSLKSNCGAVESG